MGILDLFKKKKDSLAFLQETREEINTHVNSLQTLSEELQIQIEALNQLTNGGFDKKATKMRDSLDTNQKAVSKACNMLEDFESNKLEGSPKEQARIVTMNLGALNAVLEMELKDSNSHIKAFNKFTTNMTIKMENSELLIESIPFLTEKLSVLTTKIDLAVSKLDAPELNPES
jgi:hypothetical protein